MLGFVRLRFNNGQEVNLSKGDAFTFGTANSAEVMEVTPTNTPVETNENPNWIVGDNYFGSKDFYLDRSDPFEGALIRIAEMNRRKRADYAREDDIFSNFRFTAGLFGLAVEEAAMFNVAQKLARISTLRVKAEGPQNESVEDTYLDLAVYAVIAYAIYRSRWE